MDETWQVEFAARKVYDEYMKLPPEIRAATERIVGMIKKYGLENVGMPYVRHLHNKLWEIRANGNKQTGRSLYVVVKDKKVLILRSFVKKTSATPPQEIELALRRWQEYAGGVGDDFHSL